MTAARSSVSVRFEFVVFDSSSLTTPSQVKGYFTWVHWVRPISTRFGRETVGTGDGDKKMWRFEPNASRRILRRGECQGSIIDLGDCPKLSTRLRGWFMYEV